MVDLSTPFTVTDSGQLECLDCIKWYEHDADMCKVSRSFLEITFEVHRIGEGINDEWDEEKKWYKDGRCIKTQRLFVTTEWKECEQ